MTRYCRPSAVTFTPGFLAFSSRNFLLDSGLISAACPAGAPACPAGSALLAGSLLACCWLHPASISPATQTAATAAIILAFICVSSPLGPLHNVKEAVREVGRTG